MIEIDISCNLHIIFGIQNKMKLSNRLKPNQMQLLLKIAETGQLQRAAYSLCISQPAASRILGDIESLLGGALFFRYSKGLEPTPLGKIAIRHAKVIIEEMEALSSEVQKYGDGDIGHIRVGAVTGPAVGTLIPAVQKIKDKSPNLEITIDVGPSTELVRGLVEGRFDFVISRLPPGYDSRDFHLHPALSEEVSLIVKKDHPLSNKTNVTLETLLEWNWVIQEISSPIRDAVESAFISHKLPTPPHTINSSSLLVVLSILENSNTIAPLSNEVANMLANGPLGVNVSLIDLVTPITVAPCFVIKNRYHHLSSAAERLFSETLKGL